MKLICILIASIISLLQHHGHVDASIGRTLPDILYNTVTCEGDDVNLECPLGYHIQLLEGYFGRTDPQECVPEGEDPPDPSELPCLGAEIFDIPKVTACQGSQACPLNLSPEDMDINPCPASGFKKYLNVTFNCVKDVVDQYVCEGKTLAMSCPDGEVLQIVDVLYGRTDADRCAENAEIQTTDCYSSEAGYLVSDLCNHKPYCEVEASSSMFGDPCEGTSKFLEVRYQCAPCENIYEDSSMCEEYALNGECETNPSWMMSWCRKSCWRCDVTTSCGDVSDYFDCTKWAAIGECHNNEEWMRTNCQYSCNKCDEYVPYENEVVNDGWQAEDQQGQMEQNEVEQEVQQEEINKQETEHQRVRRSNKSERSSKYDDLPLKRYYSVIAIVSTVFFFIFMLIWRSCRQKEGGSTFKKSA